MACNRLQSGNNNQIIIGIDEVGRGSLAGPVCVAAVAWKSGKIKGLNDSKKLTEKQRQAIIFSIKNKALAIGIGWVCAQEIDNIGINPALQKAAQIALEQIAAIQNSKIIVDGRDKVLGDIEAEYIIKADSKIPAVMAASIVAKVSRDNYMHRLSARHPGYGFENHVGYGTAMHRAAILELGACDIHRMSYSPLKEMAK